MCVVLFKARASTTIGNLVEHSKRQVRGFVGCNKMLEAGEYVVVPLAFNHWHTGLDDVTAYPRYVFVMNKICLYNTSHTYMFLLVGLGILQESIFHFTA